jgi:5-methylcytosine-specific restriction protein A
VVKIERVTHTEFVLGELYTRREIHDSLGGQRQGGISTPKSSPVVLIFTGETGKDHGYGFDGWQPNGRFFYTGEGQPAHGDMRFTRGNTAIRDHEIHNKKLLLFEQQSNRGPNRGKVRFAGEMVYGGHHLASRDTAGYSREVIVFELERVLEPT